MTHLNNIKSLLFILLGLSINLLFIGCTKERNVNLTIEELHVDEALAPYFERFLAEGTIRGHEIDLVGKRIEGYLEDIDDEDVVGQCAYSETSTRKVRIDLNYWNQATDLEREFVVFHELGHCYLERSHSDAQDNRTCISIMHSGTSRCRFNYTQGNRSVYLDELF